MFVENCRAQVKTASQGSGNLAKTLVRSGTDDFFTEFYRKTSKNICAQQETKDGAEISKKKITRNVIF